MINFIGPWRQGTQSCRQGQVENNLCHSYPILDYYFLTDCVAVIFIMTCYYRLCYTEATIFEIQRLGSIAPQAVPHRTLGDVTGGSKKTQLLVYSQPFFSQRI